LRRNKQREPATGFIPVARDGPLRNRWTPARVDREEIAMTKGARRGGLLLRVMAIMAVLAGSGICRAQTSDGAGPSIELVDPKVLRVCADPHNLPFSNDKGEGFENKLVQQFAVIDLNPKGFSGRIKVRPVDEERQTFGLVEGHGSYPCLSPARQEVPVINPQQVDIERHRPAAMGAESLEKLVKAARKVHVASANPFL